MIQNIKSFTQCSRLYHTGAPDCSLFPRATTRALNIANASHNGVCGLQSVSAYRMRAATRATPSRSAWKRAGSEVGMSAKSSRMLWEGLARRVGESYTTANSL